MSRLVLRTLKVGARVSLKNIRFAFTISLNQFIYLQKNSLKVSLSGNGDRIVIGGQYYDEDDKGQTIVFEIYDNNIWQDIGYLEQCLHDERLSIRCQRIHGFRCW